MNSRETICIRCRGNHARGACGRPQAVVQLLEETELDPIDEIFAAAERRGYMKGADAVWIVQQVRAQLERERKALA